MQNNDLRLEGIKCKITFQENNTPNVQLDTKEKPLRHNKYLGNIQISMLKCCRCHILLHIYRGIPNPIPPSRSQVIPLILP